MLICALDSVNTARPKNGDDTPTELLAIAERALKAAIIRGDRIEFGEPQLIDNPFVLRAANDSHFRAVLKEAPIVFCMRKEKGQRLTPATALARWLPLKDWYPSAWRVDPAAVIDVVSTKRLNRAIKGTIDHEFIHGIRHLEAIVQASEECRKFTAQRPKFELATLITSTADRLAKPGKRLTDPRCYARNACVRASKRIKQAVKALKKSGLHNNRAPLLSHVVDSSNPLKIPDSLDEWIAQAAIHMAYNAVLAQSWESDHLWASDYFSYVGTDASAYLSDYLETISPRFRGRQWQSLSVGSSQPDSDEDIVWASDEQRILDNITWSEIAKLLKRPRYQDLRREYWRKRNPIGKHEKLTELLSYSCSALGGLSCQIRRHRGTSAMSIVFYAVAGTVLTDLGVNCPPELLPSNLPVQVLRYGAPIVGSILAAGGPVYSERRRQKKDDRRQRTVVAELRGALMPSPIHGKRLRIADKNRSFSDTDVRASGGDVS